MEEHNLVEIEHLLTQSLKGVHYLFDNEAIARILAQPTEELDFFSFGKMDRIHELFNDLIAKESFTDKLKYIEELDQENYEVLLRTYFHILDGTMRVAYEITH